MKQFLTEWKTFLNKELILEQNEEFLENQVKELLGQGYQEVKEINLPNGVYTLGGAGYRIDLKSPDGKQTTGYSIITRSGIRGMYSGTVQIQNKTIGNPYTSQVYKILFKDVGYKGQQTAAMTITTKTSQQIPQEVLDADAPNIDVQNGKGSFMVNGKNFNVDLSDVFSNINGNFGFVSARAEDMKQYIQDIKPGSILIGFGTLDGKSINGYYINSSGKGTVKSFML